MRHVRRVVRSQEVSKRRKVILRMELFRNPWYFDTTLQ